MAARTRRLKLHHRKSEEKENMGSYLSSSTKEPEEKRQRLQKHEEGRNGLSSLSENTTTFQFDTHQEKNTLKSKADASTQQHLTTELNNSTKKLKKFPESAQTSTPNSGKLPVGTPRPQRPPGRTTSTSNLSVNQQLSSTRKRRVIIANQSADSATVGKETEEQGPYRKGTPHPKRKRVSGFSKMLDAGGDSSKRKCSAGEIRNRLADDFENVDYSETVNNEVTNKLQGNNCVLKSTSIVRESSEKLKIRKCEINDDEINLKPKPSRCSLEFSGSDEEPLINLKSKKRLLEQTEDDETIKSKTSKRILVYSSDSPRPPTRCGGSRPINSGPQCDENVTIDHALTAEKKDEETDYTFANPCFLDAVNLVKKGDNDLPVPVSSAEDKELNVDPKSGCSSSQGSTHNSLLNNETTCSVVAKPDGRSLKSQEEKRKRKVCTSSPSRETPKRMCRVQRGADGTPGSPSRKRCNCCEEVTNRQHSAVKQQKDYQLQIKQ